MDIFVVKKNSINNINPEILVEFKKKNFLNKNKLDEHCFSYFMLDKILKEFYSIDQREIVFVNKKPVLKNGEMNFSLSHSGEHICIAVSKFNCGVDIEEIKTRNYKKISERMNFPAVNTLEEFYYNWTEYEAVFKLGNKKFGSKQAYKVENTIITAISENPDEEFQLYFQN